MSMWPDRVEAPTTQGRPSHRNTVSCRVPGAMRKSSGVRMISGPECGRPVLRQTVRAKAKHTAAASTEGMRNCSSEGRAVTVSAKQTNEMRASVPAPRRVSSGASQKDGSSMPLRPVAQCRSARSKGIWKTRRTAARSSMRMKTTTRRAIIVVSRPLMAIATRPARAPSAHRMARRGAPDLLRSAASQSRVQGACGSGRMGGVGRRVLSIRQTGVRMRARTRVRPASSASSRRSSGWVV